MKVRIKGPDGQTVEGVVEDVLDLDNLPAGLVAEETLEKRFNSEFTRRATSLERKALEKALADPDFKDRALGAWGINLAELAKGGEVNAEKLAKALGEWRKAELEPVVAERDGLRKKLDLNLARRLDAALLTAAEAVGIRKEFRRPLTEGSTPMIVAALRDRFGYDEEHDDFFERDPKRDGEFVFSAKPDAARPYRGIEERLRLFAEDKANAEYLDKKPAKGPGFQQGGGGASGDVILTPQQASDLSQYEAAEKRATEQGGRVIVQAA